MVVVVAGIAAYVGGQHLGGFLVDSVQPGREAEGTEADAHTIGLGDAAHYDLSVCCCFDSSLSRGGIWTRARNVSGSLFRLRVCVSVRICLCVCVCVYREIALSTGRGVPRCRVLFYLIVIIAVWSAAHSNLSAPADKRRVHDTVLRC